MVPDVMREGVQAGQAPGKGKPASVLRDQHPLGISAVGHF
jgi:hypothetical protein